MDKIDAPIRFEICLMENTICEAHVPKLQPDEVIDE